MILLDSSVLIAFENAGDVNHARAVSFLESGRQEDGGNPAVTELAFNEILSVLVFKYHDREAAVRFGGKVRQSCRMIHGTQEDSKEAFELFSNKSGLSYADCQQASLARKFSLKIATFDEALKKEAGNLAIEC